MLLVEPADAEEYARKKRPEHEGGRRVQFLVQPVSRIEECKGCDDDSQNPQALRWRTVAYGFSYATLLAVAI